MLSAVCNILLAPLEIGDQRKRIGTFIYEYINILVVSLECLSIFDMKNCKVVSLECLSILLRCIYFSNIVSFILFCTSIVYNIVSVNETTRFSNRYENF